MKYYLAIKKNEILSFVRKWIELELILLHKINQAHNQIAHVFAYRHNIDLKS
jgi:hypothetical protein